MKKVQEYKTQGIYFLLGLIVLFFPFIHPIYFFLLFLVSGLYLSRVRPGSQIFALLARESDIRSGKLNGLVYFTLTTAILLFISMILGQNKFPLFIIAASIAITTLGGGVADIINNHEKAKNLEQKNRIKVYSAKSSIAFLTTGSLYAFLVSAWISDFNFQIPYGMIFFLVVIGALTGALLESIIFAEDNIIIPFGTAMTMWLFYTFSYNVDTLYLMEVLIFAFVLGYLAYRVRIADISAMLSATLLGVVIIISSNYRWFFILLAFFLLGGIFTRYKYDYKLTHGIAEARGGVRGYKNVFSNSLAALSLAMSYKIFPAYDLFLMSAFLGSIATATGDTLASEIGQTCKGKPRMITTFKKVHSGTDGGVSGLGELAAFLGAGAIALLSFLIIWNDFHLVLAVIAGGFIGTNIDSVLGATLQQKGYLSNNGVNLVATATGAIISGIIYLGLVV
jgi:uncharacterized protein (TIGR00297 family)